MYLKDTCVFQCYICISKILSRQRYTRIPKIHLYPKDTFESQRYICISKIHLCYFKDTFELQRCFRRPKIISYLKTLLPFERYFHLYRISASPQHTRLSTLIMLFFHSPLSAFRFCFSFWSWLGAMLRDISLSAGRNYGLAIMRAAPNCRCINNSNEYKACSLV